MPFIKPFQSLEFPCPNCNKTLKTKENHFLGLAFFAETYCETCEKRFWYSLPIRHFRVFPLVLNTEKKEVFYPKKRADWLNQDIIQSFYQKKYKQAKIKKIIFQEAKEAYFLNCLDSVYGHTLWTLFNDILFQKDKKVIVLIPQNFAYLFPLGNVCEVWLLENDLQDFKFLMPNLDKWIKNELQRFEKVDLVYADFYPFANEKKVIEIFKEKPFDLANFSKKPFKIAFVLREERFWLNTNWEYFLFRLFVVFKLKFLKSYFLWKQNFLFNRLAKLLKNEFESIEIYAIGLGKSQKLSEKINDFRSPKPSIEEEKKWNKTASQSHLVIGVHGSGLLAPTALSAGFIELLPPHRIANFGEANILIDKKHPRFTNFLQRSLPLNSNPKTVFKHIKNILERFSFQSNHCL